MSAISSEANEANSLSISPKNNTQQKTVGKLQIQILSCFLNVKVAKPYVIITLGEQLHKTSVSEFREGRWNETFEFIVTFHAQLFGTIQLDLYDSYTIYPDKHVGRAEIRIKTLENMPETFTSYYEIWDKKLSTGASSSIGRERATVNNVGALQATISYCYLKSTNVIDHGQNLGEIKEIRTAPPGSTDLMSEEQLAAEFKRHLQFHRERKKSNTNSIRFKKYEEGDSKRTNGWDNPDENDYDDYDDIENAYDDDDEEEEDDVTQPLKLSRIRDKGKEDEDFGEMVAAPSPDKKRSSWLQGSAENPDVRQLPLKNNTRAIAEEDDDNNSTNSKSFLDVVGSWTGTAETSQVIRSIGKLLAAFQQGFELTNIQVLTGLTVLEKFYSDLPRNRTLDIVEDLSEIDNAARFWKFSIASYGWKGLNFIGKGNGIFSDAMRDHSDAKSIIEYLTIPKEDLLAYEFRSAEAFRPSYFIARDRFTNSIVLTIRGTMSVTDTLTDLVCEYEPWKGGFIHSGMKNSAMWFFRHVAPQLIAYTNEHSTTGLIIVGHSLGASTAAILTIILTDYIDEFRQGKDGDFSLKCYGYAPACGLSLNLAEKYSDIIQSFVFADDIVSKLSYGSMMDVKELIIASTEAVRNMGISEIWSGDPEGEKWQTAFKQIAAVRKRTLESMENPRLYVAGKIYQFWLDPTPNNETRIVLEKSTAENVCNEVVVKKSIVLDHLPSNFDLAFSRARETIMLEGSAISTSQKKDHPTSPPQGILDPVPSEVEEDGQKLHISHADSSKNDFKTEKEGEPLPPQQQPKSDHPIWGAVAELGLKGTTDRTGGDGKVLNGETSR